MNNESDDQSLPVSLKMASRDVRYLTIKPLIEKGKIQVFKDIFLFVPKTIVEADIGKHPTRFSFLMKRPEKFTIEEATKIGEFCELTRNEIINLIAAQIESRKKKSTKSQKKSP